MRDLSEILTDPVVAPRGKAYSVAEGLGRQIVSGSVWGTSMATDV